MKEKTFEVLGVAAFWSKRLLWKEKETPEFLGEGIVWSGAWCKRKRKESTSVERKERVLAFSGEEDFSAQGLARGRRVCSFIGVGFPWTLQSSASETSEKGISVCSRVSSGTER